MTEDKLSSTSSGMAAPMAYFTAPQRTGLLANAGPVFWACLCGLALVAAIVTGTALTISNLRQREIQRGQENLQNTVRLLARHFDRQFSDFESVERSVANDLAQRISSPNDLKGVVSSETYYHYLRSKVNDSGDFAGVNVYGVDGNRLASSAQWPAAPVNLSDRKYFQAFKTTPEASAVMIQLVQSRLSSGMTIVIARKILGRDGQFLGMVTRSTTPDMIESFLSSIVPTDGALALLHQDGTLLARFPHSERALGQNFAASPLYAQAASSDGRATMQIVSPLDGQERIASVRYLDHYPVAVLGTINTSALLANWKDQARLVAVAAGGASAIILLILGFILHYLRRQRQRLRLAVNNMRQGLLLFDASERLILCNDVYLEMFGLSSRIVQPGTKLHEIMQHRIDVGSFVGDVERHCEMIRAASRTGQSSQAVVETPDGRCIQVKNQPVKNGGWVSTLEDITVQRRAEERIWKLANYDVLTGLPNRAHFVDELRRELEVSSNIEHFAVLFVDTDEFKAVNDSLGHHVGDELLESIAEVLRRCLAPSDFVARLGGDEFAIIMHYSGQQEQLAALVQRIQAAIRQPHRCGPHTLSVDASIGVAISKVDGLSCEELLRAADLAMYEAKASGRRTYQFFEAGMEKKARDRKLLESDLRQAIENEDIEVHFQPVLDLRSNEIGGCEALARWVHPERGYVSPADFIPIAEQSGLIEQLGDYVLRRACLEAMTWPDQMKVAVNVSPAQFKTGALPLKVASALADSGLSPGSLELEITEAVLIRDAKTALETLYQLRQLGARLALDDFGTGYSSLSYLSKFPFDKIKIDRSFINELSDGSRSAGIVRAVIALAAEHRMSTTAEGVETEQQRNMLRHLQCDEMQGFLLSPAKPAAEIKKMLNPAVPVKFAS